MWGCYTFKIYSKVREFIRDKIAIFFKILSEFFHFSNILHVCGEPMDAFTEYDARWQKDLFVVP